MANKRTAPKPRAAKAIDIEALGASRKTLEGTPARALQFLRAAGTSRAIRRHLAQAGYMEEDHAEGWGLLHGCSGFTDGDPPVLEDAGVRDAIATLDAWDEDGFRIVRASLTRHFPEQAKFVLNGITPGVGAESVIAVGTLLNRIDALEKGRGPSPKQDKTAMRLLERRGITKAERQRLRQLIADAERAEAVEADDPSVGQSQEDYYAALAKLREWFLEWSEIARSVVRRRDYLIRLGLASRRPTAGEEVAEGEAEEPIGGASPA